MDYFLFNNVFIFQIHLLFPVLSLIVVTSLVVFNLIRSPVKYGIGLAIYVSCVPVYICKMLLTKSPQFTKYMGKV